MKFVEWCELFLIGHKTIDEQHKMLFEIANNFHDAVKRGFDRKILVQTMNELVSYAQNHFATEEKIVIDLGFPVDLVTRHQKVHDKLITDIFTLNEQIESGQLVAMEQVERFIREWLVLHILTEDQKYKELLSEQKKSPAPSRPKAKRAPEQETVKYP